MQREESFSKYTAGMITYLSKFSAKV